MPDRRDVVYRYDGSFEGMICCVYDSFYRREDPAAIFSPDQGQASLFQDHQVQTDAHHAFRVLTAVQQKISQQACELVKSAYLTCLPEKEMAVLRFLRLGFQVGACVTYMLAEPAVNAIVKATGHLGREAHLLTGFVRFSDHNGLLVATIAPKNCVLPLMADHFIDRFSGEAFLIWDQTHQLALMHHRGRCQLTPMSSLELPPLSRDEKQYRALWRRFYDTIAIEERYNPICRMSHMPKRYWPHMTEFQLEDQDLSANSIGQRAHLLP